MESSDQKYSVERVLSRRALGRMGNSFPCKGICVVGFLCGFSFSLTSIVFLAALTSFGASQLGQIPFFGEISAADSITGYAVTGSDYNSKQEEKERIVYSQKSTITEMDESVQKLYSVWSKYLNKPLSHKAEGGSGGRNFSDAPHLENCKLRVEVNRGLDSRVENESFPPWTIWKGMLYSFPLSTHEQERYHRNRYGGGVHPPWITGSDEENYPLTRKVQHDIWFHQHPSDCKDPSVRFLVADWERLPRLGFGAQINAMCGLLAIAVEEKRVLVTNYYNRADHDGCKGSARSSWSCYFLPETSQECRERAFKLMRSKAAWEKGVITGKRNYTSREIWSAPAPRIWGSPWNYMQPTTEINGAMIAYHRKMDRRWWLAQGVRYLMRFQSEYTCNLMNVARHEAFGLEAAKMVVSHSFSAVEEDAVDKDSHDIEKFVWSNHKPWIPKPLLSMHVRMGDKGREMKLVGFEEYIRLAERIHKRFPNLNSIWLSTEMQEVIDKSKSYPHWRFYYTNVTRQEGNTSMATYEASLGRKTSTNYPMVNFLMASEADFFIGALGSTWCLLIDGMRNTGGKVMSGYLSVNKDRFW